MNNWSTLRNNWGKKSQNKGILNNLVEMSYHCCLVNKTNKIGMQWDECLWNFNLKKIKGSEIKSKAEFQQVVFADRIFNWTIVK